jgi:hypothetical protein
MNIENNNNGQEAAKASGIEGFDRIALIRSIGELGRSISQSGLSVLTGNDEWETDEFGDTLEVWASNPANSEEKISKAISVLEEIQAAESTGATSAIEALRDQLPFTMDKFPRPQP